MTAMNPRRIWQAAAALIAAGCLFATAGIASEAERPVMRTWVAAPPAPASQSEAEVDQKNSGCITCHSKSDASSMHKGSTVVLGCVDCHGGNTGARNDQGLKDGDPAYRKILEAAHVLPRFPKSWNWSTRPTTASCARAAARATWTSSPRPSAR